MKPGFDYTGVFAVFVCRDSQGRLLMSKRGPKARDEQGCWEFGGGGLEFGESPEEAARRELLEEYNCQTLYEMIPLPPYNLIRELDGRRTHWIGFPFVMHINPDEVRLNETEFAETLDWFTLDTLPDPLHPGTHPIIESYKKLLNSEQ